MQFLVNLKEGNAENNDIPLVLHIYALSDLVFLRTKNRIAEDCIAEGLPEGLDYKKAVVEESFNSTGNLIDFPHGRLAVYLNKHSRTLGSRKKNNLL